jgi:hypothetical protein
MIIQNNLTALGFHGCGKVKARVSTVQSTKWSRPVQILSHLDMDGIHGDFDLFFGLSTELTHYVSSPGRFFAVTELKAMLTHVLLTYDVKLEKEGVRPADHFVGFSVTPDRSGVVMFRKRSA